VVYYRNPLWQRIGGILDTFRSVLVNDAQPGEITGAYAATSMITLKAAALVLLAMTTIVALVTRGTQWERRAALALASFVGCFFLVSITGGDRVMHWHVNVNLAIFAAIAGISVAAMMRSVLANRLIFAALVIPFVFISYGQQHSLFRELDRTGGNHHFSEARTFLPYEIRMLAPKAATFFPDWGYSLEHIYLTGGKMDAYAMSDYRLKEMLCSGRNVFIPIDATISNRETIEDTIAKFGAKVDWWRSYHQRDGKPNTDLAFIGHGKQLSACTRDGSR
jgi:hypothetical protein